MIRVYSGCMIRHHTPVECYSVRGRNVYVKRDDLMGDNVTLPPWGKLEAIEALYTYYPHQRPLIHLSVDGSWSGWALAAFAAQHDHEFYYAYPDSKKISHVLLDHVAALYPATRFYPLKPNMSRVLYNRVLQHARQHDWQMLPHAFDHSIYRESLARRLQAVIRELPIPINHLVVSSGSGVSVSGLLAVDLVSGFANAPYMTHTTCVSSEQTIRKQVMAAHVNIRKSEFVFDDRMDDYTAPFPCNQFWDLKQWHWLEHHIAELPGIVLFWNLGGRYTF